jgi:hypothetical protein
MSDMGIPPLLSVFLVQHIPRVDRMIPWVYTEDITESVARRDFKNPAGIEVGVAARSPLLLPIAYPRVCNQAPSCYVSPMHTFLSGGGPLIVPLMILVLVAIVRKAK